MGKPRVVPALTRHGEKINVIINLGVYMENQEIRFLATFIPANNQTQDPVIQRIVNRLNPTTAALSSDDESSTSSEIDNSSLYIHIMNGTATEQMVENAPRYHINQTVSIQRNKIVIYDDTPLLLSCELGNFSITKKLIERGADTKAIRSTKAKKTEQQQNVFDVLLSLPSFNNSIEDLFKLLIDHGADPRTSRTNIFTISIPTNYLTYPYFITKTIELTITNKIPILNLSRCGIQSCESILPLNTILSLSHITQLDLSNNHKLTSLPESLCLLGNLEILDISNTSVKSLPTSLGSLPLLQQFFIKNVPLEFPSKAILRQGCSTILRYLREESEKPSTVMDVKMMIFGHDPHATSKILQYLSTSTSAAAGGLLSVKRIPSLKQSKSPSRNFSNKELNNLVTNITVSGRIKAGRRRNITPRSPEPSHTSTTEESKKQESGPVGFLSLIEDVPVNTSSPSANTHQRLLDTITNKLRSNDCSLLKSQPFTGSELLSWIFSTASCSPQIALKVCQDLLTQNIIQKVASTIPGSPNSSHNNSSNSNNSNALATSSSGSIGGGGSGSSLNLLSFSGNNSSSSNLEIGNKHSKSDLDDSNISSSPTSPSVLMQSPEFQRDNGTVGFLAFVPEKKLSLFTDIGKLNANTPSTASGGSSNSSSSSSLSKCNSSSSLSIVMKDVFIEKHSYCISNEIVATVNINCKSFDLDENTLARSHYLFTENTIYLILFDLKTGFVQAKVEFWLQYIYARAQFNSSIFIVGINDDSLGIPEIQASLRTIHGLYTNSFSTVKYITNVNIKTKVGIPELKEKITVEAMNILENFPEIPNTYTIFFDIIKELRTHDPPVLENATMELISKVLLKKADIENFLRYYNQTGMIVRMANKSLRDYIVLDPNWISQNPLLSHSKISFQGGIVTSDEIHEIWNSKGYSEKLQQFLIPCFEALGLIIQVFRERYIIPLHLPKSKVVDTSDNVNIAIYRKSSITNDQTEAVFQIYRLFQMAYVPPFAVMRLAARLIEVFSSKEYSLFFSQNAVVMKNTKTVLIMEQNQDQRMFSICIRCLDDQPESISLTLNLFRIAIDAWYSINRYYYRIEYTEWVPCSSCLKKNGERKNLIKLNPQFTYPNLRFFNINTLYTSAFQNTQHITCDLCGDIPLSSMDFAISSIEDTSQLSLPSSISNLPKIGEGSFGVVVSMEIENTPVALKVFQKLSPGQYHEIRREIWIMKRLSHPNIVSLKGVSISPFAIAMDLAPLGDLYEYLHNQRNDISWPQKVSLFKDIARAMQFMHSLSPPIIHRDLKSPNILLYKKEDGNLHAKVTDFGLSMLLYRDGIKEPPLSRDVQTPTWLAPEVIQGDSYTEKADVYSFGIIMSEILCRTHPFRDLVSKNLNYLIEDLIIKGIRPTLHPKFDAYVYAPYVTLMHHCWTHCPADRPTFNTIISVLESIPESL